MMVALQTHPFAIELQFDDESLTGAVHPAEKIGAKRFANTIDKGVNYGTFQYNSSETWFCERQGR